MEDFGGSRALGLGLVLALLVSAAVYVLVFGDFNADSGGMKQKDGTGACVSADGTGGFSDGAEAGDCAVAPAVGLPTALALSPDARNAYVAGHREAVATLRRASRGGALSAARGRTGCHSRDGTAGGERARKLREPPALGRAKTCTTGRGLFGVTDVAVSPDGRNVYVGSSDGLAIFDRDLDSGRLTQKPGLGGCMTLTGAERGGRVERPTCSKAAGLYGAGSVTVSPDGESVYVTSAEVLTFRRDRATGGLTRLPGRTGCVAATGTGAGGIPCVADPAIDGATAIAVSPDGRHAYTTSGADARGSGALAILARDREGGALTPVAGRAGCISQRGDCRRAGGLEGAAAIAFSPDGADAYVISALGCAVVIFRRHASSGALTQRPGDAGVATAHGDSGACANREAGDSTGFTGGAVTVSRDGRSVVVTARAGVALYSRDRGDGSLSYEGCVSDDGEGTCEDVRALNVPIAPVIARGGRDLYVAVQGGDAVAAFDLPRGAAR